MNERPLLESIDLRDHLELAPSILSILAHRFCNQCSSL